MKKEQRIAQWRGIFTGIITILWFVEFIRGYFSGKDIQAMMMEPWTFTVAALLVVHWVSYGIEESQDE